jgi:hypothetical protein
VKTLKTLAISTLLISALGASSIANAELVSRLGGLAYYDTVADLTWLADANYAKTSGYDADGGMNWGAALAWAAGLRVGGVSGWRLPDTLQPDVSCERQIVGASYGNNCTGSEMGSLFYSALGNAAGSLTNTGPFSNVQSGYWSATNYAPVTGYAWLFNMVDGFQSYNGKTSSYYSTGSHYAWAVRSGDVSARR